MTAATEETYTVFIVLEVESTGEQRWWSVDHHHDREEAWDHATEIAAQEYARTGVEPTLLDE